MNSGKNLTDKEWKQKLSELEYFVLRKKGTEQPFTGEFWDHKEKGIYKCAGCGATGVAAGCVARGPPSGMGVGSELQSVAAAALTPVRIPEAII